MKSNIHDLGKYSFKEGEQVLIDANIWIFLCPPPCKGKSDYRANSYSKAFRDLAAAKAKAILDPLVLSEYLNRYCRLEYDAFYKNKYDVFKRFRDSDDFKNVASSASVYAKRIFKICGMHSTPTDELDILQSINHFETGCIDFNDAVIVDICKRNDFKLMTDDSDFRATDVCILTLNRKLLGA